MPLQNQPVNLREKLLALESCWHPRIVGEVDDAFVKVAKLKGRLAWHRHEEDELFLVVYGSLTLELPDRAVTLGPGELFIVPKGVMHNPIAEEECGVVLVERKSTKHTGNVTTPLTRTIEEQMGTA